MILAIDVGNSDIVFGVSDGEQFVFSSRIKTDPMRTATEHAVLLSNIIKLNHTDSASLKGAVIASVVPNLTGVLSAAVGMISNIPITVVGPGVKTGLNIRIDDPATLAADLCCTAVGALSKYPLPAIIVDLGTATKITVVNEKREYIGGAIAPGLLVSLGALSKTAALLPDVGISAKLDVIATETTSAMLSGSILGTASMLDGMICRFEREIGAVKTIVACGGLAEIVVPHCERKMTVDKNLLLNGLVEIYKRNEKTAGA